MLRQASAHHRCLMHELVIGGARFQQTVRNHQHREDAGEREQHGNCEYEHGEVPLGC
jgi:hypothetical protein